MAIARGIWRQGSAGFIAAVILCGVLTGSAGADDEPRNDEWIELYYEQFFASAHAARDDDWVGREFMPRATCTPKVLNQVIPQKCLPLPFTVQKVNREWLWVGRAWVKKSDLLALDEAGPYYDAYLEEHPQSRWAGECLLAASRAHSAARTREVRRRADAMMKELWPDWNGRFAMIGSQDSDDSIIDDAGIKRSKEEWIGREFMPKATCTPKVQNQVIPLKSLPLPFTVRKAKGEWLWVGQAWVKKWEVIPVDDAPSYYFAYERRHPESKFGRDYLEIAFRAERAAFDRESREFERENCEFEAKMRELDPEWDSGESPSCCDLATPEAARKNVIAEFDVTRNGGLLVVPVTINGHDYPFVVDTGCTLCVIDTELRAQFDKSGQKRLMRGKEVETYALKGARLGKIEIPAETEANCKSLAAFRLAAGQDIRGFLGMNVLRSHVVQIDFDAGKLSILRCMPSEKPYLLLDYSLADNPMIDVELPTGDVTPFMIDLGLRGAVSIERATFDKLKAAGQLLAAEQSLKGYIVFSFNGLDVRRAAVLKQLRIGDRVHERVKISDDTSNLLGLDFLSQFKVTFDFPHNRLYLEKGERFQESTPQK